ncbi:glycosyltransferase family 39 protein [bacterium]|nr:glycosyltransferase family 39 protein [bacterium]
MGILVLLAILIVAGRLRTFHEPVERDIASYAVLAHEILNGKSLYRDLWEFKPPAVHVTYALAEILFGYRSLQVYLLGTIAALIGLAGAYRAGSAFGFGRQGGLWAATFWTIISGDLLLQANQPNTEVFINATVLWAFVLLARYSPGPRIRWGRAIGIGLLFAWASLYKQVGVVPAAFLSMAHLILPPSGRSRKSVLVEVAFWAGIGAAAWAVFFGYLLASGSLDAYYRAAVVFTRDYSSGLLANLLEGLNPRRLGPRMLWFLLPLGALGVTGAVASWRRGARLWTLWFAWVFAAPVMACLPGHWYAHYYQFWLPVAAVGGGWGVATLNQTGRFRLGSLLGATALLVLLAYQLPRYRLPAEEWSVRKYGAILVATRDAAKTVDRLLEEDETFYEFGAEISLYFYTNRPVPTRNFHFYPLVMPSRLNEMYDAQTVEDLEETKPELFIIPEEFSPWRPDGWVRVESYRTLQWFGPRYRPIPIEDPHGIFRYYARRGGNLENRLTRQGIFKPEERKG